MGLTKISGGVIQSDNFSVGVITATSLQIGSATTIHTTGIDLGSGNVTSHNINSTGIITATSFVGPITGTTATFSGDVSIGGTLTYDDVTNIDSIGVVTARSGVHFGTAASGTLVIGNSNGIGIGTNNPQKKLTVADFEGSTDTELIRITQGVDSGTQQEFGIGFAANINHTHPAAQITYEEHDASDSRGHLNFYTRGDNSDSAPSERLRVTSDGTVYVGPNGSTFSPRGQLHIERELTYSDTNYRNSNLLTLENTTNSQETVQTFIGNFSGSNRYGNIIWTPGSSNDNSYFKINANIQDANHLVVRGNGNVGIGSEIPTQALDVAGRITKTEYEPGEIIERICAVCDGSTHVVKSGSYTMTNVTAAQSGTTSDAVCSGSQISYKCPAGAKRIHYEYWFKWESTERSGISHFFIEVDDADVVPSRRTFANNFSRYSTTYYHHGEGWYCMNWVFECDASSTDTSEGQYAGWADNEQTKVIRTKFREYNGSYEIVLHRNYYWDGSTASGTNQAPIKPMLIITTTA